MLKEGATGKSQRPLLMIAAPPTGQSYNFRF